MFHNYSLDKRAIPIGLMVGLVTQLLREGYSEDKLLAQTGLTTADIFDHDDEGDESLRVSYRQYIQLIENAIQQVKQPGFWLDWDAEVSISNYGLLGYAMMSSATLERAIQIAVKYHKMAGAMFELSFAQEGKDGVLRLDHILAEGDVAKFVVEELFKGITPLVQLLLGKPVAPGKVCFNYAPAAKLEAYKRHFPCEIEFNTLYCEYRFDASLLSETLAEADSSTNKSCEAACRKLLNQMEIEEDLISRICHILLSKPGEFPKLDAVASGLSLGTRTLRRRLKGLGTSYQQILDDVKKELAMEYLQTTTLSVQEISDLLGYSEVTNFRRAFVKWVGCSPYQYRKKLEIR